MNSNILTRAIKLAKENSDDPQFKHAAILFDERGNILSEGWNVSRFACDAASFAHKQSHFHAESFALYRAYGYHIRKGNDKLSLLSIRLNKHGELRYAMPCTECMSLIKLHRIDRVYYSTSDGQIISIKVG